MTKPFKSRSIPVAENGRMNLPADLRRRMGLEKGGRITIEEVGDHFEFQSFEQRMKRIDEIMKPYRRDGRSMVDELIAERRAENAKDEAEWRGQPNG